MAHGGGSWSLLGVGGWLLPWVCRAHCPWCVADHGCGSQSQLAVAALGVQLSNSRFSSCGPGWAAVCGHAPGWAADPGPLAMGGLSPSFRGRGLGWAADCTSGHGPGLFKKF